MILAVLHVEENVAEFSLTVDGEWSLVHAIALSDQLSSSVTMSKPLHGVTEGVTVSSPNITTTQRSRPKMASVFTSSGNRPVEGGADDTPTSGKRFSAYPIQRRGSRKKTLSLNPEEREALENLIEEVIMGGVGEGVIDSDASSSDDDDDAIDDQSPSSIQNSLPGSAAAVAIGDASRQDTFVKGGKKFYPGQLKVALKHMHDLPPRFVRKLAKAQQYLDAGGIVYPKPVVSVGPIEEEEETAAQSKDDSKRPKVTAVEATSVTSVPEPHRDKTKLKENKLKDAKKMIRTLLTDRDQYVDEAVSSAVTSGQSQSASSDDVFTTAVSTSSNQNPQNISPYQQQVVSNSAASVSENTISTNAGSFSSAVTCTSSTHVHQSGMGGNMPNNVAEYVPQTLGMNYRRGQSSNMSLSGSRPIPAQPFQSPSLGISQYQLSVPVVHGMKPAQVLSQSPPGTQFWIPQAVVPSNSPGYYGSSPPVVGMTGLPSAFNQPVPYAYSIQSSYPTVQGVHTSYSPQYLYSASPPNQGLVGQPYSAATFTQPVSYPLTVLHPDHYVRPPSAMSANFYQNTPPPGYCPTQSHPVRDQRQMFASDTPSAMDGTRQQVVPADRIHSLSALSAPVAARHVSPARPANCNIDTKSGHIKPVCTESPGITASDNRETCVKCPPKIRPSSQNVSGCQSPDTGGMVTGDIRPRVQYSPPHPASALGSHRPRFSKPPDNVPLPNTCSPETISSSSHSMQNPDVLAEPQSRRAVRAEVSVGIEYDPAVIKKIVETATVDSSVMDMGHGDAEPLNLQHSSPSSFSSTISNTAVLSHNLSAKPMTEDQSLAAECNEQAKLAGDILEPHSTALTMVRETDTRSSAEEKLDLQCNTSNESLAKPVIKSHISGTATLQSVNENVAGVSMVSSDTKDLMHSTCISRTGDLSGALRTGIEHIAVIDAGSVDDHLASELHSGLNCTSDAETLDTSVIDDSPLQQLSPNPVSCSDLPVTVADISLNCNVSDNTSTSSDLVVTLSSSLTSSLVDMFGPPVGCHTKHGWCHLIVFAVS